MISPVVSFERALNQVEAWYRLDNAGRVRQFLYQHPMLPGVLVEAFGPLQKCFGPYPQVMLRVVADPEVEDSDELFAYIRTSLPPEDALNRLNELDELWFLDQLDRVNGLFNFNLEFE